MNGRVLSLLVVVTALTCYHLSQRSMPESVRPAPLFALVYGSATIVMLVAVFAGGTTGVREISSGASHWAPWLLAASVTGIELGVYAMYRAGWSISTASTSTQAIVAAILVIVGLFHFGEQLTVGRVAGLALCVLGAGLVAR